MPEEQDVQSETVCPCVHVARLPALAPLTAISWNDITVPDSFIQWIRPAITRAQSLIRERDISVVLATAPPYSNLVIGSICASQCRLPFIPDYRDPWRMMNTPPVAHQ
ncbi:MAG: hypothetical protein M8364_10615 [Methylobacter sp.]|uniref:hypothetical protein n=1 Tax=Methylobacter sp. TaxID=2051955 RepID=UPI00258F3D74|nr:hypothetical protein [Methylobacter sp.]MCL7421341.1 hypothetical protein [Methylobacter sp.]